MGEAAINDLIKIGVIKTNIIFIKELTAVKEGLLKKIKNWV